MTNPSKCFIMHRCKYPDLEVLHAVSIRPCKKENEENCFLFKIFKKIILKNSKNLTTGHRMEKKFLRSNSGQKSLVNETPSPWRSIKWTKRRHRTARNHQRNATAFQFNLTQLARNLHRIYLKKKIF